MLPETFRFYIGSTRHSNIEKLAKELFDGNKSALINYALNKTYGLDPKTGERLPNAPVYVRQTDSLFLLADNPAKTTRHKKPKDR